MITETLIIAGSGPAGLTAGLYAARAGLKPLILEGLEAGGQLVQTQHIANFPGFPEPLSGPDLIARMRRQAESAGVRFATDAIESADFTSPSPRLTTLMGDTYETRALILATGAGVTLTRLPGEATYWGRGISSCLTCDGAFYAHKAVALVGTGPATRGARTYLARLGAEVAAILDPAEIRSFDGDGRRLTGLTKTDGTRVAAAGAFLLTARRPQTDFLQGVLPLDGQGHIVTTLSATSVPGVFAAGDCAEPHHKQAILAAGDGARAALAAQDYLQNLTNRQ